MTASWFAASLADLVLTIDHDDDDRPLGSAVIAIEELRHCCSLLWGFSDEVRDSRPLREAATLLGEDLTDPQFEVLAGLWPTFQGSFRDCIAVAQHV